MSAKVVSIINLKGGVAKTTTTIQLAECLASEFSKRVLVIDLDPQTNATSALIGEEQWSILDEHYKTIFWLFEDKMKRTSNFEITQAIQTGVSNLKLPTLSLLASSIRLIDIQDDLHEISRKTSSMVGPMEVLKQCIFKYIDNYDYVLIDCPPNLGYITQNGLEVSDYYLIPTIPDKLSTFGIPQIINKTYQLANERHLKVKCLGLIYTKYSSNSIRHYTVMKLDFPSVFRKTFNNLNLPTPPIFETVMPQANATADAMDFNNKKTTFKSKYGTTVSGGQYLYEYVLKLTEEFKNYV